MIPLGREFDSPPHRHDNQKYHRFLHQTHGARVAYDLNTKCTSLLAAATHLERFEKDPEGYRVACTSTAPIYLDEDLVKDFLAWSLDEKGNTPAWVAKQRNHLAW